MAAVLEGVEEEHTTGSDKVIQLKRRERWSSQVTVILTHFHFKLTVTCNWDSAAKIGRCIPWNTIKH